MTKFYWAVHFKAADADHDGILSRDELKEAFMLRIEGEIEMRTFFFRYSLSMIFPKQHQQFYNKLKIPEAAKAATSHFAASPEIFEKVIGFALDFADVDKKGSLTEAECKSIHMCEANVKL